MAFWRPLLLSALLPLLGCGARSTPPDHELTAGGIPSVSGTPEKFFAAPHVEPGKVTDGWLPTFQDQRLESLVADAMAYNRDLAAAKARVDQAAALARQAGADLSPQLNYGLGGQASGISGTRGTSDHTVVAGAGLNLSWELDVWGRLSAAERAAQESYAGKASDFLFARQSLAAQVAKAYFFALQAVQQEQIAVEFAALQKRNAELATVRREGGRSSNYEEVLALSAASSAADLVQQNESGRERAVRSLEVLIGHYPKAELAIGNQLPKLPPPPPPGLPTQMLERRPDLIAATRRVAAAFNQVESAKASRLPRLSITAAGGGVTGDFHGLTINDAFWNLGANLIGPIFDGGRIKEQIAIETAVQQEALMSYGQTALTAFQQVETGLSEERRLKDRAALVLSADRDQREAVRLAQLRYDAGAIDQVALLTVQSNALNARNAELAVRVQLLTNRIDLHLALGGGFAPPPTTPEDAQPASKVISK